MKKGRVEINKEFCKGCDYCIIFCPKCLIKKELCQNSGGFYQAVFNDPDGKCNACKLCGIVCPEAAIEIFLEEENFGSGEEVV